MNESTGQSPQVDYFPEPYVVSFYKQGFPGGEFAVMLGMQYEIKLNGLEHMFKPFRR